MKLLAPALLVLFAAATLSTGQAQEPAAPAPVPVWSIHALLVTVDTCPVVCPCLFGQEPHHGVCTAAGVIQIKEGHFKDVSLAGVKFGFLLEFAGDMTHTQVHYIAYYIDSNATVEQRTALRTILGGPPFSEFGTPLGIKEVPVDLQPQPCEDPTCGEPDYAISIGDLGKFKVGCLLGGDGKHRLAVENPTYTFPADKVLIGPATGQFSDYDHTLTLQDNSGEISEWTLTSAQ